MKKSLLLMFMVFLCYHSALSENQWKEIACGTQFSVAIKADGTMWAWGSNMNGQLGIGTSDQMILLPVQVGTDADWAKVACGGFHVLAIKNDGTLWAWGFNANGEIGDSTIIDKNLPVQITRDNDWKEVSASMIASFAIKTNGTLWAWGWNSVGQIGIPETIQNVEYPLQVGTDNDWDIVTGGGGHALALKQDGSLWGWGFNTNGQVGIGNSGNVITEPTRIGIEGNWVSIAAGFEFSLALKNDNSLWSWGFNGNGQLGITGVTQAVSPTEVVTDKEWSSIFAGSSYAFAIASEGTLWGWGYNLLGSLGDGTTTDRHEPVQVGLDNDWLKVACAEGSVLSGVVIGTHTISLKETQDDLCGTGSNGAGQLGNNSKSDRNEFECNITTAVVEETVPMNEVDNASIYPNPAVNQTEVSLQVDNDRDSNIDIIISDIMGNEISRIENKMITTGSSVVKISVSGFPSGFYIVTLRANGYTKAYRMEVIN